MRRLALALLLTALACPRAAYATSSEEVSVKCPVCDNEFKADQWMSSNSLGGQDRDFCEHAAGGQVFLLSCWTCPRCCYTGSPNAFDPDELPKELVARLKKENPLKPAEPIDPKTEKSGKIPSWVRYDLWIQILKLDPATPPVRLADKCLRAGQTQRFEWDSMDGELGKRWGDLCKEKWQAIPEEKRKEANRYDLDMTVARALEADAADETSALGAAGRTEARVGAAVLYKMRGEDADAQRALDALGGAELPADVKAVADDIRVRIERERKYRLLAIPLFEKHMAEGKPEEKEATAIRYLLGALYRRTGDTKKAVELLEPLLADKEIPDGFKEWIRDEIAQAKAG